MLLLMFLRTCVLTVVRVRIVWDAIKLRVCLLGLLTELLLSLMSSFIRIGASDNIW